MHSDVLLVDIIPTEAKRQMLRRNSKRFKRRMLYSPMGINGHTTIDLVTMDLLEIHLVVFLEVDSTSILRIYLEAISFLDSLEVAVAEQEIDEVRISSYVIASTWQLSLQVAKNQSNSIYLQSVQPATALERKMVRQRHAQIVRDRDAFVFANKLAHS